MGSRSGGASRAGRAVPGLAPIKSTSAELARKLNNQLLIGDGKWVNEWRYPLDNLATYVREGQVPFQVFKAAQGVTFAYNTGRFTPETVFRIRGMTGTEFTSLISRVAVKMGANEWDNDTVRRWVENNI